MSSTLFIEPVFFGSHPGINDNAFARSARVSAQQADIDHVMAVTTITDERNKLSHLGFNAMIIKMKTDPRGATVYQSRGDAIFPNNSISFHNFTDDEGKITRRIVILYPMSKFRRDELPRFQVVSKLEAAAKAGKIELVDLRGFEDENRSLEGTGALNFSADGRYVYMSRSGRTDDEVLDIVCSPENLNIPKENRFLFSSGLPPPSGGPPATIYHTNIVGWCGRGICAWGLDFMRFDDEAEIERFYNHLESNYQCVLKLNEEEIRGFVGNSIELAKVEEDGRERKVLCMSETAKRALQPSNLKTLIDWYNGDGNLLAFYGEALERRTGGSIRCTMAASITHGDALPAPGERTILEVCGIEEK